MREELEAFVLREARLLDERRYAAWLELFADDGVYWIPTRPGQSSPQEAFVGSADEIAEKIGAYARVGIKGFIVTFAEPFDIETIERLATEVRPRLEQLVAA